MKSIISLFLFILLLSSCKQNEPVAQMKSEIINPVVQEDNKEIQRPKKEINNRSRTNKLLQGLWQNIDDQSIKLEFKNSKKIDILNDIAKGEGEIFTLTDGCEDSKITFQFKEKDKFLSVISSENCFYIARLDGNNLHLGDMMTGKTLKYKKIAQ